MPYRPTYKSRNGITKESKIYWTCFTTPNGKFIRQSTRTRDKRLADQYEARLKKGYYDEQALGIKKYPYWEEAVVQYVLERGSNRNNQLHFRILDPYCKGKRLNVLEDVIPVIKRDRLGQAGPATVNRTLAYLRAVCRLSGFALVIPQLREPPGRVRWISSDESDRLLLSLPNHTAEMVRFTLSTGVREANVVGLTWDRVDMERHLAWVQAEQVKNRETLSIPLNEAALAVLRRQRGKHPQYVFTYEGRPVTRANTKAYREGLKKAGIEGFTWHDLRHTWASWHAMSGTPLEVLQKLGGWKDYKMVLRYAHLAESYVAEYADRLQPSQLVKMVGG